MKGIIIAAGEGCRWTPLLAIDDPHLAAVGAFDGEPFGADGGGFHDVVHGVLLLIVDERAP